MARTSQLRIYTINRGEMEAFIQCWREKVVPLRHQHGFTIDAAWTVEGENRFIWIVSYEGEESWDAKVEAYLNDPARQNMSPQPTEFIAHMEVRLVTTVAQS